MGIGISYTGRNGTRQFSATDGADAMRQLQTLVAARKKNVEDAMALASQSMDSMSGSTRRSRLADLSKAGSPPGNDDAPKKVMPGGSVVDGPSGLCLRGEEQNPLVEGVKIFSSVNGRKGFHSIDEIDLDTGGATCGPKFGCDSEDADDSEAPSGKAVRIPFVSRNCMKVDEGADGMITIYEFVRELVFSPGGRRVFCTGERRRVVGSFVPGEGGGGNGKYGVRLFSIAQDATDPVHPTPDAFAFGTEANLDTYNEDSGQFECNYEGGQVKDDPPVKVIAVMTCPGGIPGGS